MPKLEKWINDPDSLNSLLAYTNTQSYRRSLANVFMTSLNQSSVY